jgi:phytoene dehydrogenase-like protein
MGNQKRVAIIGGGHNGLVCAFYLARAGMQVQVFERRGVVGGAAVTETFFPGFRNSTASYTVSLLHERIIEEMALKTRYGLTIVERPISNFLPLNDHSFLKVGGGLARTQAEVAKYSSRDAQALPAYYAMLEGVANVLRDLALRPPPNFADLSEKWELLPGLAKRARQLGAAQRADVLGLFTKSATTLLNEWFESEPIKAAFGFDSIVGHYASPDHPGSAYVLLHHCFGGVNGKPGIWGHALGGMGAITQAMAKACTDAGVMIHLDAPIANVSVNSQNCAAGITTEAGKTFDFDLLVSNTHPKILFEKLVPSTALPEDFRNRIKHYRSESGTLRMNVALSELPRFACLPEPGEHHASGIIMAPSLAYMDAAHHTAKQHGYSRDPIVEILIPSTVDDSLAPKGQHVASLFCQHFAYQPPHGLTWDELREQTADHIINTVNHFAPNFRDSILGRMTLTPVDLERLFGLIGGDIFHGHITLDQLWSARPVLGYGSYRSPIKNLYMCGSGTHPGGGVSGQPGFNAAREILRDQSLGARLKLAWAGE